jgi:hypothetical protein
VAANPFDAEELDLVATACNSNDYDNGKWTAAFLAEYARQRMRQAVEIYQSGLHSGWKPTLSLRVAYDQARAKIGLWEDLSSDAGKWLEIRDRPSDAVDVSIHALLQADRTQEAFQLAVENADDFPDDPDALHILAKAARGAGREDWVRYFMDFTQRFPNDRRAGKMLSVEEVIPLLTQPNPWAMRWEKYYEGVFPLHFLDDQCFVSFEAAIEGEGLLLWRPGIRGLREDPFDAPILLDITAVLSIEQLDMWDVLNRSRARLVMHPTVVDYLRQAAGALELEARGGRFDAALPAEALFKRQTPHTIT